VSRTKLRAFFTTGTRPPGPVPVEVKFVTTAEGVPQWLVDAIHVAHQGDLPHDWIYAECQAAAEAFDEGNLDDEEGVAEYADARVDVYTAELFAWAAEFCLTRTWAEAEAQAKESGAPPRGAEPPGRHPVPRDRVHCPHDVLRDRGPTRDGGVLMAANRKPALAPTWLLQLSKVTLADMVYDLAKKSLSQCSRGVTVVDMIRHSAERVRASRSDVKKIASARDDARVDVEENAAYAQSMREFVGKP
jgi:hypothetical protein